MKLPPSWNPKPVSIEEDFENREKEREENIRKWKIEDDERASIILEEKF